MGQYLVHFGGPRTSSTVPPFEGSHSCLQSGTPRAHAKCLIFKPSADGSSNAYLSGHFFPRLLGGTARKGPLTPLMYVSHLYVVLILDVPATYLGSPYRATINKPAGSLTKGPSWPSWMMNPGEISRQSTGVPRTVANFPRSCCQLCRRKGADKLTT